MTARRLVPAALVAVLALGGVACSSSGSGSSAASSTTTEAAEASTPVSEASSAETGADESDGTNPGVEALVDGPADATHTVTFSDGSWEPGTLQVAPGQVFTFVSAPGGGTKAVTFNGSDTYTISGGLTESFTLATPGTYTVSEYLSGETMTVVVTG